MFLTGSLRMGAAGDDAPTSIIPCQRGKPKYPMCVGMRSGPKQGDDYVGLAVTERTRGFLKVSNILEHGVVQDWEGLEALISQAYTMGLAGHPRQGADPSDGPLLITEHHLNPRRNTYVWLAAERKC